jgi:hypothetical protein
LAERLVVDFGKVGYFVDWQSGFPDAKELLVGYGLKGVTREKYFWDVVGSYDLIVYPDCWNGDQQEFLRSRGMRVWGAGKNASLELARWDTKSRMEKVKLPVNESEQIHGLENLRVYLQLHDDVFVKISAYRGLGETFESQNYEQSKGQLDELRAKYGPMMDVIDFVVEKKIPDAAEQGYDGYCIDGEFPDHSFFGFEIKDKAYFGKYMEYDELPKDVRDVNTKLSYTMEGYRQFFSTELRNEFLIDVTARQASPAGETYCHAFKNLAEILWEGAAGVLVHPECDFEYAAQIILCSEWAEEHFQPLEIPEEVRPYAKIYNHAIIDGVDYSVPQIARMKQIGSVVGLGNTPEEACDMAKQHADKIKGYDVDAETDALDKAVKLMEEAV